MQNEFVHEEALEFEESAGTELEGVAGRVRVPYRTACPKLASYMRQTSRQLVDGAKSMPPLVLP